MCHLVGFWVFALFRIGWRIFWDLLLKSITLELMLLVSNSEVHNVVKALFAVNGFGPLVVSFVVFCFLQLVFVHLGASSCMFLVS